MNKQRLLNVAKALRESPNPGAFTMMAFQECGTPACALGHYAARTDLQDAFELGEVWGIVPRGKRDEYGNLSTTLCYAGEEVCAHFDISEGQATQLFSDGENDPDDSERYIPVGCGNPRNAIEAAEYIERFVERNS